MRGHSFFPYVGFVTRPKQIGGIRLAESRLFGPRRNHRWDDFCSHQSIRSTAAI
jgi:hypothetical protein